MHAWGWCMALCARTHARFLKTFVFPVLFGHNYGPQKQKNPHQNFVCRLGKSTSICAIDLAVQHISLYMKNTGHIPLLKQNLLQLQTNICRGAFRFGILQFVFFAIAKQYLLRAFWLCFFAICIFSCPADSSIGDIVTHSVTEWVTF